MDIYAASDGSLVQLDHRLAEYGSLDQLCLDIAGIVGIDRSNVLLFLEDGREIRDEVIQAAWDRGGQGTTSSNERTTLFLFNRETFWSDPDTWAAQLNEEVQLPPQLNLSALSDIPQAQHPFLLAIDHLSHLQSLFVAQSRALQIAYANLSHHLAPLLTEFANFTQRATKELETEANLLKGSGVDMAILPKVVIHEAFLKKKDKDREKEKGKERDGSGIIEKEKVKTLADYVHPRKMEQVRETCWTAYEDHVSRYEHLVNQMQELEIQSEAERRALNQKSEAVAADFAEGLEKVELAVHQVEVLLSKQVSEGAAQDLMELDKAMREDLMALTSVKNDFTLDVHLHIRQVALFQSRITEIVSPLSSLDSDLRSKTAFPHLHRLKQLPFAYAASVIEVVRRKEFSSALTEWLNKLQSAFINLADTETGRRMKLKEDVLAHLPWQNPALDDSTSVQIQLSFSDGSEVLNKIDIGRPAIDDLVSWADKLQYDTDILKRLEDGITDPTRTLRQALQDTISNMGSADESFRNIIHDLASSLTAKGLNGSVGDGSPVDTAKVSEIEEAHLRQIRELSEASENRETALRTRQAELQEELVRLRTDLEEEMLARQALSAQLEETARDHEDKQRDHDDQSDFITSLQAELAQEKDRATDLGVRLQEALLDVDGLRNAEQSLIGQVQHLQEERKQSMQTISEAQLQSNDLESQVAGLRAELEATSTQLASVQVERDTAFKNQATEAERLMRDRIAEADGDRAVLEHQNLTLNQQLDALKLESEEKLSTAKNNAIRQSDGLKAELSLTRAQLRNIQRRETVLADELAMAKDAAKAMTRASTHQNDVSRDAVTLVAKYFETCQRLLNSIHASSTISGTTASTMVSKSTRLTTPPASETVSISSKDEMRESVLVKSLASASAFDLVQFSEAVQKTINLVKKWSKSCKSYRDLARNRISFTNFAKGDLALFLPTRNVALKSWAAFNLSAPHNFLKVDDSTRALTANKEWMIARITKTDEAVASGGDSSATNPFGLTDGIRYFVHEVEEYDPNTVRPSARRTVSLGNGLGASSTHITPRRSSSTSDGVNGPSPFTPTPIKPTPANKPLSRGHSLSPSAPLVSSSLAKTDQRESSASDSGGSPLAQSPPSIDDAGPKEGSSTLFQPHPIPGSYRDAGKKLSPVEESHPSLHTEPGPFALPPQAHSRTSSIQQPLLSGLGRRSPRMSGSPRELQPAVFSPSSLGRPASVTSNVSSSHLRAHSSSKAAPAMAITTSNQSSSPTNPILDDISTPLPALTRKVSRKASSTSLRPSSQEDVFRPSPLGTTPPIATNVNAQRSSSFQSLGTQGSGGSAAGSAGEGAGSRRTSTEMVPSRSGDGSIGKKLGSSPGLMGSRLMRGFSGKGRVPSGSTPEKGQATAIDMLRKFGENQ